MTKSKWTFDSLFCRYCKKVPVIGKSVANYYKGEDWFKRFVKFGLSGVIIYWLIRAPITFVVTEYMNIHYLLSAFLVGLILTFIWFALSEYWVWEERR